MKKIISKLKCIGGLTWFVVFCFTQIDTFTVYCLMNDIQNDTLITCFYSVFGGEILFCALIKIFKLKRTE